MSNRYAPDLRKLSDEYVKAGVAFWLIYPDPADTPDVEITASVPGQGNFPTSPHYLAPPMSWQLAPLASQRCHW